MPISRRAISAFRIFHSLLSNSDCASDSPWNAWSAFFSRKSWISLCSDRTLSLSIWESCTLSKSRILFNLSTTVSWSLKTAQRPAWISPRLNVSENKKHWFKEALTSRSWENSGEANRPASVVSYTSDDASTVVARSSRFVWRLPSFSEAS